jgi:hypothetical protein
VSTKISCKVSPKPTDPFEPSGSVLPADGLKAPLNPFRYQTPERSPHQRLGALWQETTGQVSAQGRDRDTPLCTEKVLGIYKIVEKFQASIALRLLAEVASP